MQPLLRSATTLLVGVTAATALSVVGAPPPPVPDPATRRAVAALLSGSATGARAAVPTDFSQTLGYTPVLDGSAITNPSGSCSSPVPLPQSFERACRQHDYGYDLLRYAAAVDGRLPSGARTALDDQFEREALASCPDAGPGHAHCTRWAHIAAAFVRANSWRQHQSVPAPEDPVSVATGGATLLALGSAGSLLVGCVRLAGRRLAHRVSVGSSVVSA